MEAFSKCKHKSITTHKLRLANDFRLCARVITIADLADVNGRQISPDKLSGQWRATTNLHWPNLPPLTTKMIEAFRLCMRKTFCSKPKRVLTRLPMVLDKPLGKWFKVPWHQEYEYYCTQEWIYESVQNSAGKEAYQRYRQLSTNTTKFCKEEVVESLLETAISTDAYTKHSVAYPLQPYALAQVPMSEPEGEEDATNKIELHTEVKKIEVTDGSVDPATGMAAYAWILPTRGRSGYIRRKRPVLANPKYMNFYRAELYGLVDLLQYIASNDMNEHEIELWCDSKSVVDRLTNTNELSFQTDPSTPSLVWLRMHGFLQRGKERAT